MRSHSLSKASERKSGWAGTVVRAGKLLNWGEPEQAPYWSNGVLHNVYIFI